MNNALVAAVQIIIQLYIGERTDVTLGEVKQFLNEVQDPKLMNTEFFQTLIECCYSINIAENLIKQM